MPRTVVTSAPRRLDLGTGIILTGSSSWEQIDQVYNILMAGRSQPRWDVRAPARVKPDGRDLSSSWKAARRHAYLAIRMAEGRLRRASQREELSELTHARFGLSERELRRQAYTWPELASSILSSYLSIAVDAMRKRDEERRESAMMRTTRRESARAQQIFVPWKGTPFQNRRLIVGQGRVMGVARTNRRRRSLTQLEILRYERLRAALIQYWQEDTSRVPSSSGMRQWERYIIAGRDLSYLRERRQALGMPAIIHIPAPRELARI